MKAIYYLIKRSTLVEIADAIREVKGLDSTIPVARLDDVLRGILSRSTARSTEHEEYLIKLQTLVDIADLLREIAGNTESIPVKKLAITVLKLLGDYSTTSILGKAKLGIAILGTGHPQLKAPIIYLEEVEQLEAPVIYLHIIEQLDAPVIYLEEIEEELPQLEAPVIYIEEMEPPQLDAPVIYLEEVEPPQLAAPVIYLEKVAFEGDVTTAYEDFGDGISFSNATILSDEVLLDSAISSYTVEIDGVENICTLYGNSGLWVNGAASDLSNTSIILCRYDAQGTAIVAPTHLGEVGEVHYVKITETVEKPVSYVGTTWKFPESLDADAVIDYISTYGTDYYGGSEKNMLGFVICFDVNGSNDGTTTYYGMEFHSNGDEGNAIYYYYEGYNGTYGSSDCDYVGDLNNPEATFGGAPNPDAVRTITLNEEPSAELLDFLNTFASRVYLIHSGDYALTTSPAEDVYSLLSDAGLTEELPFSIYLKLTNVSEGGFYDIEYDHIDITESGIVYVYDDDADSYFECYADVEDGDVTYFTIIEDSYVSELEYKVFEALKYYDSNLVDN